MKAFAAILLIAGVIQGAPVLARSSIASPLLGSWAVDVTRLPIPPAARPKSVTISFNDAGAGKLTMNVEIIEGSGAGIHSTGTAALDGSAVSIKGSPEADIAAMTLPQPDVLIVSLGRGGIPASTRIYAAAADGKTMVETAAYFGYDGRPIMRTNYFKRVR
jgi:hypothetical protein